jgi:rSAM/selenodomain-associated transferase 1
VSAAGHAPFARRGVLVIFAKAPRPGLVKTRMSPPLSADQAAELYGHLLDDVLCVSAEIALALALDAVVTVHPADATGEMARRVPAGFRVIAQRGRNLSERMGWAVAEAAAGGAGRILVRGSDSPTLGRESIDEALAGLEEHDLVLSPDLDGGYALVGLRKPATGLFDHPMSTGTVLRETLANANRLGLASALLAPCFDLDTAADLAHLSRVRTRAEQRCPRTLAYLDAEDLWRYATPD